MSCFDRLNRQSPKFVLHRNVSYVVEDGKFPTIEEARAMPRAWHEMSNDTLLTLCGTEGDPEANEERLIREIMTVDSLDWKSATKVLSKIEKRNTTGFTKTFGLLPYQIGLTSAVVSGALSLPLVFHFNLVVWFNEKFVTTDVPEDKDLETWLEVGSWAWNWMEPPLGTLSFVILTAQFARNQIQNLGIKPYTATLQTYRAERLCRSFPSYNKLVLADYAVTCAWKKKK